MEEDGQRDVTEGNRPQPQRGSLLAAGNDSHSVRASSSAEGKDVQSAGPDVVSAVESLAHRPATAAAAAAAAAVNPDNSIASTAPPTAKAAPTPTITGSSSSPNASHPPHASTADSPKPTPSHPTAAGAAGAPAASTAPTFVAPRSYLRPAPVPRPQFARHNTSAMQRQQRNDQVEFDQVEGLHAIRAFLKVRTTYDVLPLSYRLIVLDTALLVKKSLGILIQCGIVSAPLWDSKTSTFAGLLTTSDYLNVVQYYWQNPDALAQIDQFRLNSLRDIERALGVTPLETVSIHPLRTLYEACGKMLESRARRIPLVDVDDETQREMVVSVLTQYRILKFVSVNVKETQALRKPLRELKIGTYKDLVTAAMDTPVMEVIHQLVKRSISSVPILDADGTILNLFEAVDVIGLIKGGDYDGLQLRVGEALTKRSEDFPGIYTCTLDDRLDTIFETIRKSRVHRLVIIDESRQLVGLLSLSDILDYTLNSPIPDLDVAR